MKYYISKTDVRAGDPEQGEPLLIVTERVLTKPSNQAAAVNTHRRWVALGIENIHVIKHSARYNKLLKAQNKAFKEAKMTVQDLAEIAAAFPDPDQKESEGDNE